MASRSISATSGTVTTKLVLKNIKVLIITKPSYLGHYICGILDHGILMTAKMLLMLP